MPDVTHVLALSEKPGKLVWAGAERHLRLLLPALVRTGVDVEAIVLATGDGPTMEEGLREWERAGVRVTRLGRRVRSRRWRSLPGVLWQHLRLWAVLRRHRARVVHLHLDLVAMVLAAIAARCPRIVITLHNETHLPRSTWAATLMRAWLHWIGRRISHFVAISERVREHFLCLAACPGEKMSVIDYGYELPNSGPTTRTDLGWPEGRFLVGFVGRLVFEKNPLVLIEAMAVNPDMSLVMVGDGPLRSDIERLVAARGLTNVQLAGAIENACGLLPLVDVLCLPSHWEGLGLVLVEAMLQDVPIVGSRRGAIPDILGDGEYGLLFHPDRPDELAAALRDVRRDSELTRARTRRASEYARRRFSITKMAERTCRVYEDAAAGPRGWSMASGKPAPRVTA